MAKAARHKPAIIAAGFPVRDEFVMKLNLRTRSEPTAPSRGRQRGTRDGTERGIDVHTCGIVYRQGRIRVGGIEVIEGVEGLEPHLKTAESWQPNGKPPQQQA
jgi:hypothetical protein